MRGWRLPAALLLAASCAPWLRVALAHDASVDHVVTMFVRPGAEQADVLLRVPLELLSAAPFPTIDGRIDMPAAAPAIDAAVAFLTRGLAVFDDGRRVAPVRVAERLSLPSDHSFSQYETAAAHLDRAAPEADAIYANQGFFDAHLRYPIRTPASTLSIRSDLWPEHGASVKFAVRYLEADGTVRPLVVTRGTGRVALNPTAFEAARWFFQLGMRTLAGGSESLLLLACLVVPLRGWRNLLAIVAALTAGRAAVLVGTAFNLGRLGLWFGDVAGVAIAAALVYVALENIVRSTPRPWIAGGVLGALLGFGLSYQLRDQLPFAGPHVLLSAIAFDAGLETAQLLIAAALAFAAPRLMPDRAAARMGVILLSAVVVHVGWHAMIDRGSALRDAGWPPADIQSLVIVARWIAGIALASAGARYLARRPVRAPGSGL